MKPRSPLSPYLLLAPTFLFLVLFFVAPLFAVFRLSFFDWDLLTPPRYVGLANFRALFESGELIATGIRTFLFSALVVGLSESLGLVLAILLNRRGLLFFFARGAVFSAYVVSWVAVALLWMWILDADAGLISGLARLLHIKTPNLLADPRTSLLTLGLVSVWKITGYAMVIFLAGLQDIPQSYYEAAALDGADSWAQFKNITWPLLRPSAAFVGTTSLIVSFQAFDVVRVVTQGGPVQSTTVFVYAIYEHFFRSLRVGRASAMTTFFFVVLLGLTALQLYTWNRASKGRAA